MMKMYLNQPLWVLVIVEEDLFMGMALRVLTVQFQPQEPMQLKRFQHIEHLQEKVGVSVVEVHAVEAAVEAVADKSFI